ncbi:metal-dependent hydrolase [Streptomyces tendae]|uniref:metal-dependent hydrolase n=1 Tax=Streptomyces tendae TaxID=1932 RepID=UPI00248FF579|nr:metal-dependent hydrolase [Streptomyces tendae]
MSNKHVPLKARKVSFAWEDTPLHWVPGDPFTTHTINVLHLLLPAGERWFVHVYQQVLPYIRDERLREDVIGFIGQEAMHSRAHDEVLPHLRDQGLDPTLADGRAGFRDFHRRGRQGLLPSTGAITRSIPGYLSRAYHPSRECSTEQAVAYLATSPAAVAASAAVKPQEGAA